MIKQTTYAAIGAALTLATPAVARDPILRQPIACTLGETCYIQQYVDHDASSGTSDFRCSKLTYDGHKGTAFGLYSLADQAAGVDVLAAAPGTVVATRNHMPDILSNAPDAPSVDGVECGNGLVIRHGDGWETQYCHMMQDSIIVSKGDRVAADTVLGQVGLSGRTEFPHLHLSVRHRGTVIDPFDADGEISCTNNTETTLWEDPITYVPGGILAVGFSEEVPAFDDIKAGGAHETTLVANAASLVAWGFAYGGQVADTMAITITGPDGTILYEGENMLERNQAQFFRAGGKRLRANAWPTGRYSAIIKLIRDGEILDQSQTEMTVERP